MGFFIGGTNIKTSRINILNGHPRFTQASLSALELESMGDAPRADVVGSNVCMPNQVEKAAGAKADGFNNTEGPASDYWYYKPPGGPYTSLGNGWVTTRMSEFKGAYTPIPTVNAYTSWVGSTYFCNLTIEGYSDGGPPYSIWLVTPDPAVPGSGTIIPQGAVVMNKWFISSGNVTYRCNVVTGSGRIVVYIKDGKNCGSMKDISTTASYP
jgi:hypothetical protein